MLDTRKQEEKASESIKDAVAEVDAVKENDAKASLGEPPRQKGIESLQHYFGKRSLGAFDNSEIFRTRLFYQLESATYPNCSEVVNKDTGVPLGIVPRMQLRHAWRMANSPDARKVTKIPLFSLSFEEWEEDFKKLDKYLSANRSYRDASSPVLFSDVWELPESEYEMIGLKKPKQMMALMQTAILGEIEENQRLIGLWRKIKNYPHKVALEASNGGIFSDEDARKFADLNITCLNDIKKHDIFEIKNLILEFDFEKVVKDINTAYKNDLERRRDFRYKVYPFIAAFKNLVIVLAASYFFQYTLINNSTMTTVIMALLTLTVLDAFVIFLGGLRGKRRRAVIPGYQYYTPRIIKNIVRLSVVAVFCIGSVFLFYQRYDGYDDTYFYRDLGDGTIAIAGIRNADIYTQMTTNIDTTTISHFDMPASIDNKIVTKIDRRAFAGDDFVTISLPDTLKHIDKKAFVNCENLMELTVHEGVKSVGKKAFRNCTSLDSVRFPSTLETLGDKAFVNSSISRVTFATGGSVDIGKRAFEGCYSLESVIGMSSVKSVGKKAFIECMYLGNFTFSQTLEAIGESAFEGCISFSRLVIPSSVKTIGERAFYGCNGIAELALPFVGTSPEDSPEQSIDEILVFTQHKSDVDVTLNGTHPISKTAFANTSWMTSLTIGDGITSVAEGAFAEINSLSSVYIAGGMTAIPAELFRDCTNLKEVTGLSNVASVGASAFSGCSSLASIPLGAVTTFGSNAFSGCSSLTSVRLSESLASLATGVFSNTALTSINLPETLSVIPASAFENCKLQSTLDLSHVKKIESSAFKNNYAITTVKFAEDIESIGKEAFYGCSAISTVKIPDGITSIGKSAFSECSGITNITVPFVGESAAASTSASMLDYFTVNGQMDVTVTLRKTDSIHSSNFKDATSLRKLIVEAPVTTIEPGSFDGSGLHEVSLPDTVTTIPSGVFTDLYSLTTISAGGVQTLDSGAFSNCYNLKNVHFPSLTTIGSGAFSSCNLITGIGTVNNLSSIGDRAFSGCTSLKSLSATSSLKNIGDYAFLDCTSLTAIGDVSGVETIGSEAFSSCYSLGNLTGLSSLTSIGARAFANCSNMTSIVVPASIKTVGNEAFANSRFNTITLSDGITAIGDYAFSGNTSLSTVNLPSTLTSIGDYAFYGCISITSIDLSDYTLTKLGKYAFYECSSLGSATLPTSITAIPEGLFALCYNFSGISNFADLNLVSIGASAFSECNMYNLALTFKSGLKTIGKNAFKSTYISYVSIPTTVTSIGENSFANCSYLKEAVMPFVGATADYTGKGYSYVFGSSTALNTISVTASKTVTSNTFSGASNSLASVNLGDGITSIGKDTFYGFSSLTNVSLPSTLETIGTKAFYNCTSLASIIIPVGVTTIADETFRGCSSLSSVNFNTMRVSKIGKYAFSGTKLSSLAFNSYLKTIDQYAFYNCSYLTSVTLTDALTSVAKNAFGTGSSTLTIYVPTTELRDEYSELFEGYNFTIRVK